MSTRRCWDQAVANAPAAAAEDEAGNAGGGERPAGGPRGGQTNLGGRQSTLGQAMSAGARVRVQTQVGGIMQTIFNYELQNQKFPARAIVKDGQPLLSWRVEILKLMDPNLYRRFKLDEPWDSENNKPLLDLMPAEYDVGYTLPSGHTAICLLYTSPSPRDATLSRMPSSA